MITLDDLIDKDGLIHFPNFQNNKGLKQVVLMQKDQSIKKIIIDMGDLIGYISVFASLVFDLKCEKLIIKNDKKIEVNLKVTILNDNALFDIDLNDLGFNTFNVINYNYNLNTRHNLVLNNTNIFSMNGCFESIKRLDNKGFITLFANLSLRPVHCENLTFHIGYNHVLCDDFIKLVSYVPTYFACKFGRMLIYKVEEQIGLINIDDGNIIDIDDLVDGNEEEKEIGKLLLDWYLNGK